MLSIMMLMMTSSVQSSDTWDRPLVVFNITPYVLNFTNNLDNLQEQLNNETAWRILNDTYLQNQINVHNYNISQLFNTTIIYGQNISYLYNLTYNMSQDINNIEGDINNIQDDIFYLYNYTYNLSGQLVVLNNSLVILNQTLTNFTVLFNTTIDNLYNLTYMINSTIKQPYGDYLSWNNSYFWINETKLNYTINNISENKEYLYIGIVNVTGGNGYLTTNYSIEYLLTRITINGLGIFRSECVEFTNGWIIDKDRIPHNQVWDIEKNYAINDKINCTISSALVDGLYNITLTYINNGLI